MKCVCVCAWEKRCVDVWMCVSLWKARINTRRCEPLFSLSLSLSQSIDSGIWGAQSLPNFVSGVATLSTLIIYCHHFFTSVHIFATFFLLCHVGFNSVSDPIDIRVLLHLTVIQLSLCLFQKITKRLNDFVCLHHQQDSMHRWELISLLRMFNIQSRNKLLTKKLKRKKYPNVCDKWVARFRFRAANEN
jgi:hypothetical protein